MDLGPVGFDGEWKTMGFFAGTLKNRGGRLVLAGEVKGEIDVRERPRPPLVPRAVSGWFSAEISTFRWDLSDGPPATLAIPGLGDVTIDLLSEVFVGQGWSMYRFEGRIEQPPSLDDRCPETADPIAIGEIITRLCSSLVIAVPA